ncbi:DUF6789 family protein [Haloarchaeobius amylolyticus]|uniref:DUF6789 family protein n=1 Tax=Haloarchaeobius amylolyticus TaxID=1198296 RepID=UPI0022702F8C|nr:DUF6789 family protein [Haloarchaeobius amylolyticus]
MGSTYTDVEDETIGEESVDEREREDELRAALASVAAGIVGTALMTLVLVVINAIYGPSLNVFATLAELAGGGSNVPLGFVLFFGAGAVAWPLLFVTLGAYLPGKTRPQQGMVFAAILWTGFVTAFATRYTGTDLLVFFAFSIVTHLVYGYLLGFVSARLTGHYERPELAV